MSHQYSLTVFQEILNCKIKLFKTAKQLFGHCWAIYCCVGRDKSNTYLITKTLKIDFHFMGTLKQKTFILNSKI